MRKQNISPGQALLLLIDHHQTLAKIDNDETEEHKEKAMELCLMYLEGRHDSYKEKFDQYLQSPLLENFTIMQDPDTINNDPTRRYFETNLAFHTLKTGLEDVDAKELKTQYRNKMAKFYFDLIPFMLEHRYHFTDIEDGSIETSGTAEEIVSTIDDWTEELIWGFGVGDEYFDILTRFGEDKKNTRFSSDERDKIRSFTWCSVFALLACNASSKIQDFGVDYNASHKHSRHKWPKYYEATSKKLIPGRHLYEGRAFHASHRGRLAREGELPKTHPHHGSMKSTSPIPAQDPATISEIDGHSENAYEYTKPSEKSTFKSEAQWVKDNYSQKVHPFINSISGTAVGQIRALIHLAKQDKPISATEIQKHLKFLISTLLYSSGGHSLHEFVAPMKLQDVIEELQSTAPKQEKGFEYDVGLISLFFDNNEKAFFDTIDQTIEYNSMIVKRSQVLDQISNQRNSLKDVQDYSAIDLIKCEPWELMLWIHSQQSAISDAHKEEISKRIKDLDAPALSKFFQLAFQFKDDNDEGWSDSHRKGLEYWLDLPEPEPKSSLNRLSRFMLSIFDHKEIEKLRREKETLRRENTIRKKGVAKLIQLMKPTKVRQKIRRGLHEEDEATVGSIDVSLDILPENNKVTVDKNEKELTLTQNEIDLMKQDDIVGRILDKMKADQPWLELILEKNVLSRREAGNKIIEACDDEDRHTIRMKK